MIFWNFPLQNLLPTQSAETVGKVSPILVKLTSRSDSNSESSNVNLKENKPDGVNSNSDDIDYYLRKNEGKILWFSADCTKQSPSNYLDS